MNQYVLPNVPWEERQKGCSDIVWRYSKNPIIHRNLIPSSNSIFNSAVVHFNGRFAGVFRCDNKKREMNIHRGFSDNGIDWNLDPDPIDWRYPDKALCHYQYRYDPRVVWLDDRFYVTWCNGCITDRPSGWGTPSILRLLLSWKMPFYLLTGMGCFSLAKLIINT